MLLVPLLLSVALSIADAQSTSVPQASEPIAQIHAETLRAEFRKGIVIVPCTVAGVPALRCALDTGSSMTGMSPELVKRLKLTPVSEPGAPSSSPLAYTLRPQKVQLGTNAFNAERMGMAPLSMVSKAVGETVDVLLGTSAFEQMQITIDPEASEVRIAAPGAAVASTFHPLQIIMPLHVPVGFVQIKTVNGWGVLVPLNIDTGSMPALLLSKAFFDAHPGLATGKPLLRPNDVLMTVDGMRYWAEFHDVPAVEPLQPSGVLASKLSGGFLGAPVLNRFVITYDLGRSAMYISPLPDIARPFEPLPSAP